MFAVQLLFVILSAAAGPWSTTVRVGMLAVTLAACGLDSDLVPKFHPEQLKIPLDVLLHFNFKGVVRVLMHTFQIHRELLPRFASILLGLYILGLFEAPAFDENRFLILSAVIVSIRLVHTLPYIAGLEDESGVLRRWVFAWLPVGWQPARASGKCCGVAIQYPRGLYTNAIWSLMYNAVNELLLLHAGTMWMHVWHMAFKALCVPSLNLPEVIASTFGFMSGTSAAGLVHLVSKALAAKLLAQQGVKLFGYAWYHGHRELHQTKDGVYLMFHKQHHINHTPMPSDSRTENVVELANVYVWSNFAFTSWTQTVLFFLFAAHTGCRNHNSSKLMDKFSTEIITAARDTEGKLVFHGSDAKVNAELKGNHIIHHLKGNTNFSLADQDNHYNTLQLLSPEERTKHGTGFSAGVASN